jgi:hypothetical protein
MFPTISNMRQTALMVIPGVFEYINILYQAKYYRISNALMSSMIQSDQTTVTKEKEVDSAKKRVHRASLKQ